MLEGLLRAQNDLLDMLLSRVLQRVMAHLSVSFEGEDASGPGLVREWMHLVCSELFKASLGLFEPTSTGDSGSGALTVFTDV